MQYKNTIEAIYIQLNEIQQNVAGWGAEDSVRNLDIDLTLAKLRDVYDSVLTLKNESNSFSPKPASVETDKTPTAYKGEEKGSIPVENIQDEEPIEIEFESEPVVTKREPTIQEVKEKIITDNQPKEKVQNQASEKSVEQAQKNEHILNDGFSSTNQSGDLANHLKNRPITSISSAIGLNDKFEFIHNLFDGSREKYEETIEKLNLATNFNEVYNYLSESLDMDMKDPLVQKILELTRRKLIVK